MQDFLKKFRSLILSVLSCFDRVIFKGHLPFHGDKYLNHFVDHVLQIRRKDFLPLLQKKSERLVQHAKDLAEQAGRQYLYLQGSHRKEPLIAKIMEQNQISQGLVAVLCCQETCRTVKLRHAQRRPELAFAYRPQRVLYFYQLDPEFGLMYVRLESWFPYTIQVYVNGHDWLERQLRKQRLRFQKQDNAFTQLASPRRVQQIADKFCHLPWIRQLDQWARRFNPLLRERWLQSASYYWTIQQAEYSTDVLFASRDKLSALYSRLLNHATINFSASDILGFLGRRLHGMFQGEVVTDSKKHRHPGARIKHRVKNNWLKMYDKFSQIVRIETVINDPREFRVRRQRERNGARRMLWCPMNKGVANFYQYQRVASAANERYLQALSVVNDPQPSYQQVKRVAERKVVAQRSYAGFNPASSSDVRLFQAVINGDHHLHGFCNRQIRERLFRDTTDPQERRRLAARTGRMLKRLHVRMLIAKIPRTRRWRITMQGQKLLGAIIQLHYHGLAHAA